MTLRDKIREMINHVLPEGNGKQRKVADYYSRALESTGDHCNAMNHHASMQGYAYEFPHMRVRISYRRNFRRLKATRNAGFYDADG